MSLSGHANWLATVSRAGFFGRISAGAMYEPNERHNFEISLGTYSLGETKYGQANAAYRYSFWHIHFEEQKLVWNPFQMGIFTVVSGDSQHFFAQSPSKYPSANYYDETLVRYGLEIGSTLAYNQQFEINYCLRIIDSGLVAVYNNAHRDLQYYVSSALALHYRF